MGLSAWVLVVAAVVVVVVSAGAVLVDRRYCEGLPHRVAVYGLRAANGCLLYPGETLQPVGARWEQHADPTRQSARHRDFKWAVDYDRSTIVRWARGKAHAERIERRMILALAFAFRWGRILGLPHRYLGNTEHNRRPHGALEAVCFAVWAAGYELVGWLDRGVTTTPEGAVMPKDGRWCWPWEPDNKEQHA